MLFIGALFIVAALGALSISLGIVALPDRAVRQRLLEGTRPEVEKAPISARIRQLDKPEDAARYVATQGMLGRLERNLMLAGHPGGWSMRNIILAKILIPVPIALLMLKLAFVDPTPIKTIIGIGAIVVGYFVPDLLVHSRATERQDEMQRSLPDILDKIVITIESGLGFEAALANAAGTAKGPLADELVRTVQDVRLGVSRRGAYEALQARTTSEDVQSFIRGIIQAEEHGSSISGMVRIQSKEMRMKRKLRAEAKAGQVSVKLLGPLMLCIFPVLFIVVLAPGIMSAMDTF
ncbi:secretion system protein [Aeromicrobium sp. A1-2]|uniref:type II secretion system F family protein n=1 Tax=Aeromicrobium sp. A1-2 TaxID=2107713 RepID=UPI000E4E151F|nr:type II secretion system F family protein [Aeromicrobium sp. A1-2]AXT85878.1 secretion system protein [Aeromicrobium sp. A1-2]